MSHWLGRVGVANWQSTVINLIERFDTLTDWWCWSKGVPGWGGSERKLAPWAPGQYTAYPMSLQLHDICLLTSTDASQMKFIQGFSAYAKVWQEAITNLVVYSLSYSHYSSITDSVLWFQLMYEEPSQIENDPVSSIRIFSWRKSDGFVQDKMWRTFKWIRTRITNEIGFGVSFLLFGVYAASFCAGAQYMSSCFQKIDYIQRSLHLFKLLVSFSVVRFQPTKTHTHICSMYE
jgi:hypothetical protein